MIPPIAAKSNRGNLGKRGGRGGVSGHDRLLPPRPQPTLETTRKRSSGLARSGHIHLSRLAREAVRQSRHHPDDNSTGHPSLGDSTHRPAHADMRLSTCVSWFREVAMCESRRQVAVICRQPASGESLPFRATYFSICPSPAAMGRRSSRQGVQRIGDDTTFVGTAPPRHAPFLSAPNTTPRRHRSTTCCSTHNASPARPL